MRKRVSVVAVAAAFAVVGAFAQTQTSGQSTQQSTTKAKAQTPKQFLTMAAQGSQAEIKMGQLAQQKGTTQQVKDLGARLVNDHENLYRQIQQVASSQNITVPDKPNAQQEKEISRLESMSGEQFDRAFLQMQERDHRREISAFQRESKNTANPQIAELAKNAIPTLQEHYHMSQQALAALPPAKRTPSTDESGNPNKK
jgi:putative membrane protein